MATNPAGAARAAAVGPRGAPSAADIRHPHYQTIKAKVHQELLNRLNLERLARISRDQAEPENEEEEGERRHQAVSTGFGAAVVFQ